MMPVGEPGPSLGELSASSCTWAPGARGHLGSRVWAPDGFPSRERSRGPGCHVGGSCPRKMHPPHRGCPNLLPNSSVSFPLFLGDEKHRVINSHDAGCLRLSEAVRTGLVRALVLTAWIRLPTLPVAHGNPGEEGLAGRGPLHPPSSAWDVCGPFSLISYSLWYLEGCFMPLLLS